MKTAWLTITVLLIVASGCAGRVAEQDAFSGAYQFVERREMGRLVVSSGGEGKWLVEMGVGYGPLKTHPLSVDAPMTMAHASVLAAAFVSPTPLDQVTCLASTGRNSTPVICRVPAGVDYQVANAMQPLKRFRSATGYILVLGTAAGSFAFDLERLPR